jgi:hypothetical protein
MRWCEEHRVDYVFGLARNQRLVGEIAADLAQARAEAEGSGNPARRFKEFLWTTLDSWSRRRRVIAKAEWTQGEANPRFIVTSLKPKETGGRFLYERVYCARGDMENRIKECQADLFAGRTSTRTMRANQLRLWFAAMAYVLMCALRRLGLKHTQFAEATCGTIRLKLLKAGSVACGSVLLASDPPASRAALGNGPNMCTLNLDPSSTVHDPEASYSALPRITSQGGSTFQPSQPRGLAHLGYCAATVVGFPASPMKTTRIFVGPELVLCA